MRCFLLLLILATPSIHAHQLLMFAFQESDRIQVNVYYAGGEPASARIDLVDNMGEVIQSEIADADGQASLPGSADGEQLIAQTADGHRAVWPLKAAVSSQPALAETAEPAVNTDTGKSQTQLESQYLSRQIALLRLELQRYQSEIRLSDMVAGVAIILAIAGWWLWWRERKKQYVSQDSP